MNTRAIPGWEGLYSTSDDGRVYSHRAARFLNPSMSRGQRYLFVHLRNGNEDSHYSVHRLVALTWLGPPPSNRHQVNHRDGNRQNNSSSNLEWCTPSENVAHAWKIGLTKFTETKLAQARAAAKASQKARRILTSAEALNIRTRVAGGAVQSSLAVEFGVSPMTVSRIVNNHGYIEGPYQS